MKANLTLEIQCPKCTCVLATETKQSSPLQAPEVTAKCPNKDCAEFNVGYRVYNMPTVELKPVDPPPLPRLNVGRG